MTNIGSGTTRKMISNSTVCAKMSIVVRGWGEKEILEHTNRKVRQMYRRTVNSTTRKLIDYFPGVFCDVDFNTRSKVKTIGWEAVIVRGGDRVLERWLRYKKYLSWGKNWCEFRRGCTWTFVSGLFGYGNDCQSEDVLDNGHICGWECTQRGIELFRKWNRAQWQ